MLKIFLSYTKADANRVAPFYKKLVDEGFDPWMDVERLIPGQNWEAEIDKAFNEANVIIIFLSRSSVVKRGFVQREANEALANLRYKLPDDIYIVPILLESCDVPDQIARRLQFVAADHPDMWSKLTASLKTAADQQKVIVEQGAIHGPFRVFEEKLEEIWDGSPGHSISIAYPRFTAAAHAGSASELSDYFRGRAAQTLLRSRQKPWDQFELYLRAAEPTDKFVERNGRWETYAIEHASDNFMSLTYMVGWYGAGAAHPNSFFETVNFAIVEGRTYEVSINDLFDAGEPFWSAVSNYCIAQIKREFWQRSGTAPDDADLERIETGAGPNADNFSAFVATPNHITFHFSPYHVAAYAFGSFSINVPMFDLLPFIRKGGPLDVARGFHGE